MIKHSFPMVLTLASSVALAQEGPYLGGGVGFSQVEEASVEENAVGLRVFGGWRFDDTFAVEAMYADTGEADAGFATASASAFGLSVLAHAPLGERGSLFGKIGGYAGESETTFDGGTFTEDENGLFLGFGGQYDFGNGLSARGDFDWFDTEFDALYAIAVSLQYRFGRD